MIRKAVLGALLTLTIPQPVAAQHIPTGMELYQECKGAAGGDASLFLMSSCGNYLLGVLDGATQAGARLGTGLICNPRGITLGQLQLIYTRWAESNPLYLNYQESDAAMMSLLAAFPCKHH